MGQLVFQANLGGQVNLNGPNTASTFNLNVPAVSGDLVTTGDTGTVTAAMLAATTGSGNVVLSTSPTLVTPNLGTPSALVGTNITGTASGLSVGGTAASATNVSGGATGSINYQSAASTTAFLSGNTTTTPKFVTSTGTGSAAQAPTLTSSTGSGNVVLATSPTLVTPALGTPSALVGTNITGTASGLSIGGTATTATNVAGGAAGSLIYQTAAATSSTLALGTSGYILTAGASAPTYIQTLPVANGGTGGTSQATARTGIGAAASGSNTDITSIALTTGTISTAPSANTDIVNKLYADSIASGVNFHAACQYGTTADLGTVTYNNGTSGVGATITNAGTQAALAIDGYTFTGTDVTNATRVLVKNQTTQSQNGAYTVTNQGSGSTNWVLTRATDYDTSGAGTNEVDQGDFILVINGTANANTSWVQQTPLPITIGTTNIVFTQFGGSTGGVTSFSAGTTGFTPSTATTGVVTLAGTLATTNGGTGLTSFTANGIPYASSTSALTTGSTLSYTTTGLGINQSTPAARLQIGTTALSSAAWTTSGLGLRIDAVTYTSSAGLTGTVAANSIAQPTLAATTASQTITNAATLYIANGPAQGTNVTITNPYSLYTGSGQVFLGGGTQISAGTQTYATANFGLTGVGFSVVAATYNIKTTVSAIPVAAYSLGVPTFSANSVGGFTNAYTLYIAGAPLAGTNLTFGNSYALYINSGDVYFGGALNLVGGLSSGLTVNNGVLTASYNAGTKLVISGNNDNSQWTTSGQALRIDSGTYNDNSSSGTVATVAISTIAAPTITAASNTTYTNASTLYIAAAPIASAGGGGTVAFTNSYALYVAAGSSFFGGSLVGGATLTLFNTASTTVNFAGAGTTIGIGATTGTLTLNNPTVVGSQTTVNLFNTTSTTVNFAGAATTMLVGTATTTNFTMGGGTASAGVINLFAGPTTGVTLNLGTALTTSSINVGTAQTTGNLVLGNTSSTTGQIQLKSNLAFYQPAPPTTITATGALVVASMKLRIIQVTSSTAVTLTPDTGTTIDAAFSGMATDTAFEFTIINTGSAAGAVTMAVATGVTYVGSLTVAINTSGTYRARKTAANTFVMYRVA